ncbi:MAG: sulfatase-like hydrolase/transferase [Prevotellaceae bacterium]|nr:sulfatase-like hydrolase/transferase [Prevotellaceae bacterium]
MLRRFTFLLSLLIFFLLVFALGKVGFLCYNQAVEPFLALDLWQVLWHGLPMDLSTASYLVALPWLFCLLTVFWHKLPVRRCLTPYYIIICTLVSLIIVGDTVMYGFWHVKLDSTILPYLRSAEGATNSVSLGFLAVRLLAVAVLSALLSWIAIRLTPRRLDPSRRPLVDCLLILLLGGCVFVSMRGGLRQSTMNVGEAYYSQRLYLNHAAVNPAFSLVSSISKQKDFARQFQMLPEEQRAQAFNGLYEVEDEVLTDTLLNTRRPDILVILMESFGASFVEELGGAKGVAPNLSRLIPEGVFFSQYYSNSFRTDRGIVSALSGWVSYPTLSLMRIPGATNRLPSVALSLTEAGYQCDYLYGGDIKIMGKQGYLVSSGYTSLTSITDFPLSQANESKWGVNDSITARRLLEMIRQRPYGPSHKPWHTVYQTLSSHEPWQVPYQRLSDPVLNAFAFTDHCLGALVDSLKELPQWQDMLVILLPDHNASCAGSYQDPEFFRCPMLWIGGAVREPRQIDRLCNQSDLAATLLSQLGLRHDGFPWSRNVLSTAYRQPFVYCTYPSGVMLKDSLGATVLDLNSLQPVFNEGSPADQRLRQAKAILQTSYQQLHP